MTKATKQFDSDEEHDFHEELPQEPAPIPVEKPLQKRTKKDRSEAQKASFEKCLAARRKRAEEQLALKAQNDDIKQEVEQQVEEEIHQKISKQKPKRRPRKKPIIVKEESSSSDDEPQVIYIKRKGKKKPKKRIEYASSSEEDTPPEKTSKEPVQEQKQEQKQNPDNVYMNKLMLMRSMGF